MIYLTICVEDCKDAIVNIEPSKIYFKGTGGSEKKSYEYTLELYEEIDAEVSECCLLILKLSSNFEMKLKFMEIRNINRFYVCQFNTLHERILPIMSDF